MKEEKRKSQSLVLLTGIKPTGSLHLGNYFGSIRPYLDLKKKLSEKSSPHRFSSFRSLFFVADYHALTSVTASSAHLRLKKFTYDIAASLMACGVDPNETLIYRQSDISHIFELAWILSCFTSKGLMNRAHAYKMKQSLNREKSKKDLDFGINMGLFSYPILMASDILAFRTNYVPVGEDQIQHIEMTRDIAQKFNHFYQRPILQEPEFVLNKKAQHILGLDGKKMSKSYNNFIPLFDSEKKLKKLIMKIKTDSTKPEEPKDPKDSTLFLLYQAFANPSEIEEMKEMYSKGVGWSEVKEIVFKSLNFHLKEKRESYNRLIKDTNFIEDWLQKGAQEAQSFSKSLLLEVRSCLGVT